MRNNLSTEKYYEDHAVDYFNRTVDADMSHMYSRFLAMLPSGGHILDAGAGSGRDMRVFSEKGFSVLGIDCSISLAKLAQEYSGATCLVGRFEEMACHDCFDGVWACASLLHIERSSLPVVLTNFFNALRQSGVLLASVREGKGTDQGSDGRHYTFYDMKEFSQHVTDAGFIVESSWETKDVIAGRSELRWINVLARKA